MKKYLSALIATMLLACCLGLVACGDSGSSSSAASDSSSSAAATESSSEATESGSESEATESESESAADPSEKFVGDWKLAGLQMNGVIVIGDLSAMDVGTASLNIAADGKGAITLDDTTTTFTWKQTDDDTLAIEVENAPEETAVSAAANATYEDDTVRINLKTDDQEGTIIFSKDGNVPGLESFSMDDATDITSEDALIGTWKVSGATMDGATMYGDSEALATMTGSEEMILTFEEGGTVTMLGSDATWSVGENGVVITDGQAEVAVKALGDDIVVNIGEVYGMNMLLKFSK